MEIEIEIGTEDEVEVEGEGWLVVGWRLTLRIEDAVGRGIRP